MGTPDIIALIFVIGSFVAFYVAAVVHERKRSKERAELVEKAAQSEAALIEWWQQAKTVTVQVGGERIVFKREDEEQTDGHLPQDSRAA